jgi:hypothetical protein
MLGVDRVHKSITGGLLDCISIAYSDLNVLIAYYSRTFLIYFFTWFARVSYERFVATHCKFKAEIGHWRFARLYQYCIL